MKPASPRKGAEAASLVITGVVVWGTVLLTAAIETAELTSLISTVAFDWMDAVSLSICWGFALIYNVICLWSEQANQYHRYKARFPRRMAWTLQALIALMFASALTDSRTRSGAAVVLFFMAMTAVMWRSWIKTRALHPDDQKTVDDLVDEEQRLIDQAHEKQRKQIRDVQLQTVLARMWPNSSTGAPTGQPIKWNVTRGRHSPIVYFIRNGNRIKIGTTTDLYQRIRRLALRSDDIALILPGGRDVERSHHKQFSALRVGNTEWFKDAEPLTSFITDQAQNIIQQTDKDTRPT